MSRLFGDEAATYSALRSHQGRVIPNFLAEVDLDIAPPGAAVGVREELCHVKGILLEYLQGFPLSTITEHALQSSWQNIVDQAIQIIHVLDDENILNADVRPDKFIVVPKRNEQVECQVYMIDLAQCRLRKAEELEADWGRAKWIQDEEGAIGAVMRNRLSRIAGFQVEYKPSWRYLKWAPREGDD